MHLLCIEEKTTANPNGYRSEKLLADTPILGKSSCAKT